MSKETQKPEASIEMMDMILTQLPQAPENDMEQYVRDNILEFNKGDNNPTDKYEFLVEVSKLPCTKINDKACVGDISSFVRELCALDKHYLKPVSE